MGVMYLFLAKIFIAYRAPQSSISWELGIMPLFLAFYDIIRDVPTVVLVVGLHSDFSSGYTFSFFFSKSVFRMWRRAPILSLSQESQKNQVLCVNVDCSIPTIERLQSNHYGT